MKVELIAVGKTNGKELITLVEDYKKRFSHYFSFDFTIISEIKNVKNLSEEKLKNSEGELILQKISPSDKVVVLCERGKQFSSLEFADFLQLQSNNSVKKLVFIIGGAYGFSNDLYKRADYILSISKMTFSHQMIRLLFIEQLYRAATILKNEPYHHR